jgi:predicted transposase YdaD
MSNTPHDALFKATFSQVEHAAAALRAILPPALAARINFGTLALVPGSFIDQRLASSHSDLLFSAKLSGRTVLIHVLFEHQSSDDPLMPFRLLRYMVRIWDAHVAAHPDARRLPAIVPVVLHHSKAGWQGSVAFEDLLDLDPDALAVLAEVVPRFRFVLDDISAETDEALKARAMTALGRLVLWCFRHARRPEELVRRLAGWLDVVREAQRAPNGRAALAFIWQYILTISEPQRPEELLQQLLQAAGPEIEEEIVSIADYLEEKGRLKGLDEGHLKGLDEGHLKGLDEGRLKGLDEGRLEGQRRMLLKLLGIRFGALPESAVARIQAADAQQIDRWTERVLSAATLGEVLAEA